MLIQLYNNKIKSTHGAILESNKIAGINRATIAHIQLVIVVNLSRQMLYITVQSYPNHFKSVIRRHLQGIMVVFICPIKAIE